MLTSSALGISLSTSEEEIVINVTGDSTVTTSSLNEVKHLYDEILKGDSSWSTADSSDSLKAISRLIQNKRLKLQENSRSAKMWLQYIDMTLICWFYCVLCPVILSMIYFRPEPKINSSTKACCWDIHEVQKSLGKRVCYGLLFAHAITGCDTTSRLFGIGKSAPVKKLQSSKCFC